MSPRRMQTSPAARDADDAYILIPVLMTTTYIIQLREYCAFDLKVLAESQADALEKAQAFYAQVRKPAKRYIEDGLRAELVATTLRCSRQASSQSALVNAKAAARGGYRGALRTDSATGVDRRTPVVSEP